MYDRVLAKGIFVVAVAILLATATSAAAADATLQARLFGQRGDQDASGRAIWSIDSTGQAALVIQVAQVSTSEMLLTFVDGQFVGTFRINSVGAGMFVASGAAETDGPRPGSIIELVRAEDEVVILSGVFRRK